MKSPKVVRDFNRRERAQRELLAAAVLFADAETACEDVLAQEALALDGAGGLSMEQRAAIARCAEANAMLVRCARRWAEVGRRKRRARRRS